MNALPDPTTFLAVTPAMRARLESTIEQLMALLDAIDGDPDREDNGDDEAYLAGSASDFEDDPSEGGIADRDALMEIFPHMHDFR